MWKVFDLTEPTNLHGDLSGNILTSISERWTYWRWMESYGQIFKHCYYWCNIFSLWPGQIGCHINSFGPCVLDWFSIRAKIKWVMDTSEPYLKMYRQNYNIFVTLKVCIMLSMVVIALSKRSPGWIFWNYWIKCKNSFCGLWTNELPLVK